MSRIRSIHPGLWTDEAFVTLSAHARLFFMGLWNECDDQGSFEWSPLKLKMRLAPADNVDGAALLAEIAEAGCVLQYEVGGKRFGAVRNFCQYQRPKKPTSVHPQTEEVRKWVNTDARSTRDGSEAVENQLPTSGEKSRQRKEEGGSGSSVAKATGEDAVSLDDDARLWADGKAYLARRGVKNGGSLIGKWIKANGKADTAMALTQAQLERPGEVVPFIEGWFRRHSAKGEEVPIC